MSTAAQIKTIHTLKTRTGLDDADYRGLVALQGGKTSSKDLSEAEAEQLIGHLRRLPGGTPAGGRRALDTATGRFGKVLQALWLSAYDLGLVRDRTDKAMMRFVERQTGLSHVRFLRDPADARRAIEGLKGWIAREGGVAWPGSDDVVARRYAVCAAIAARLHAAGGLDPAPGQSVWPEAAVARFAPYGVPDAITDFTAADLLRLANLMGPNLRAGLAEQAKTKGSKAA